MSRNPRIGIFSNMRPFCALSVSALLAGGAIASFDGNINYASPSKRHSGLGINIPHVERRAWKRGNFAYDPSELDFTHGVASGDPWADSVILWTRIAPSEESDESEVTVDGTAGHYSHETEKYIEADPNPICLEWAVYESTEGNRTQNAVAKGTAYTTSDIDYTVKVKLPPYQLAPALDILFYVQLCFKHFSTLIITENRSRPQDYSP
jgi:alkaline phosphatase D